MAAAQTYDVAVVGHFSIDSLKLPYRNEPYTVLGGAVAYVSLIVKCLGGKVAVYSKVGSNFPNTYLHYLREEGVDVSGIIQVSDESTTSFELTYSTDLSSRILRLKNKGSPLIMTDLPLSLNAGAIHIAPIAGELSYEIIEYLRKCSNCLSIDPQGLVRRFDATGAVTQSVEMDKRMLSLIDVYRSSFEEITVLTEQSNLQQAVKNVHALGPAIVIVTLGAYGSVLSVQGDLYPISAYISRKTIDPTGGGDAFIGAFLTEYIRHKKNPLWCACVGSAASSLAVEGIGTTFSRKKEDIYNRAYYLYEK